MVSISGHVHKSVKSVKEKEKAFIGFEHDNWNLMLHMIFGVSKSIRIAMNEEAFDLVD